MVYVRGLRLSVVLSEMPGIMVAPAYVHDGLWYLPLESHREDQPMPVFVREALLLEGIPNSGNTTTPLILEGIPNSGGTTTPQFWRESLILEALLPPMEGYPPLYYLRMRGTGSLSRTKVRGIIRLPSGPSGV